MRIAKGAFSTLVGVCFETGFAGFTLEICMLKGSWAVSGGNLPLSHLIQGRSQASSNLIVLSVPGIQLGSSLDVSYMHSSQGILLGRVLVCLKEAEC